MTQYCYDTETLLRFSDRVRGLAITVPIVVGIMPIHDIVAMVNYQLLFFSIINMT